MTRWRVAAVAGILSVLAAGSASAAGGVRIDSVDTTGYPRVSVTISLSAQTLSQTPRAADFAVLVDGARPSIDVFATAGEPVEVVVAIDTSGSMQGNAIAQARAAAISFVEQMPDSVQLAVVGFATSPEVIAPFGTPVEEIVAALRGLEATGNTALYDAVVTASAQFTGSDARRVIVLLSDGGDTSSEATLDEAVSALEPGGDADDGIELRAVALITSDTDVGALGRLSTGWPVISVNDASDLTAAYLAVAQELTGQFRLSFSTSATGPKRVEVFVNTAEGVVSDARVVEFPPSSVTAGTTPPSGPVGEAPVPDIALPTVIATPQPGLLGGGWGLPAGVGLVFLGLGATFWMVGRNGEGREVVLPLHGLGFGHDDLEAAGGTKSRFGSTLRILSDRVARGKMVREGGLDLKLDRAGLAIRPGEFVILAATAVIVAVTAGLVFAGIVGAVLLGATAALAPRFVVKLLTSRRREAFAEQLEGSLQIIAGSMRAGHALVQAISIVAAESESPTSDEFNRVIVETRLGRSMEDSLAAMATRMENEDLGWVVEAIEIQHEVGGNLVEVLDAVMTTIRDRNQMRRQVKALSAEGRMSAFVLLALPFVIAGFIATVSPDYLTELTGSSVGRILLVVALVFMALGALWIKKLIKVDF